MLGSKSSSINGVHEELSYKKKMLKARTISMSPSQGNSVLGQRTHNKPRHTPLDYFYFTKASEYEKREKTCFFGRLEGFPSLESSPLVAFFFPLELPELR